MKILLRKMLNNFGIDIHRIPSQTQLKKLTTVSMQQLQWLKDWNIKTILDIGANTGQFSRGIHQLLPEAQIYAFEPLPDCYAELKEDFAHILNCKILNIALGALNGKAQINCNQFSPASSLLPSTNFLKTTFPYAQESILQEIKINRLDDIASELDLREQILIKVDVQGFEDQVIAGGMAVFQQASVVLIELSIVHLYEGQLLFDEMYTKLKSLGFKYRGNYDQARNAQGEILYVDSIFTRT